MFEKLKTDKFQEIIYQFQGVIDMKYKETC